MSLLIARPFTGRTSEGAPGSAGPYSAQNWRDIWQTWQGQNKANRGVLRGVDNELAVTASSPADTNVNVGTGAAHVDGAWAYNNASKTVAIAANASGSTRIDIIVLVMDTTAQTISVAVVQGTPAAGLPSLTQTALIYQIPLAYLTLASGFISITSAMITDMREYANIPANIGVDVTNSSGAALDSGSAVIWLAAGGAAINTTTTEGNRNVAGVVEGRIANAASGRIITNGITSIICDESVAVGDILELSTTTGQAQKATQGAGFARVLTANTGAGTKALAFVNVAAVIETIVTGTYSGDGNATKAVTGIGFKPRLLHITNSGGTELGNNIYAWRSDRDASTNSHLIGRTAGGSAYIVVQSNDTIRSLDNDGFTVGDCSDLTTNLINANGVEYHYEAWR